MDAQIFLAPRDSEETYPGTTHKKAQGIEEERIYQRGKYERLYSRL